MISEVLFINRKHRIESCLNCKQVVPLNHLRSCKRKKNANLNGTLLYSSPISLGFPKYPLAKTSSGSRTILVRTVYTLRIIVTMKIVAQTRASYQIRLLKHSAYKSCYLKKAKVILGFCKVSMHLETLRCCGIHVVKVTFHFFLLSKVKSGKFLEGGSFLTLWCYVGEGV